MLGWHGQLAMQGRAPLEGPLSLVLVAYMPVPASWSRKRQEAALRGEIRPGKPDVDNLLKQIDGLNTICWRDDSQIAEATISKRYDLKPRLEIEVAPLA
jgi:Holliday junction resolvase RusA-like endonuclease